jgi:hypothetical protein
MDPTPEIRRLLDVMPASGRMHTKIVSKSDQSNVIDAPLPMPWIRERPIRINFELWRRLSKPQRDLTLLRAVSWLMAIRWFQVGVPQGMVSVGLIGGIVEVINPDAMGLLLAAGLTAAGLMQLWRDQHNPALDIEADNAALRVAQRRGYAESDAAKYLQSAITSIAAIEGRSLNFGELLRCQNLQSLSEHPIQVQPDRR